MLLRKRQVFSLLHTSIKPDVVGILRKFSSYKKRVCDIK